MFLFLSFMFFLLQNFRLGGAEQVLPRGMGGFGTGARVEMAEEGVRRGIQCK
jgi:hypothetical protein